MLLRNFWYVAAWSADLGRTPIARIMLGDSIVLYRAEDGTPVALENRCPHRNLPLSNGRLVGDALECGYHGMVFVRSGACTHIPGQTDVPKWARIRTYPSLERLGWVLVWMGDPALANPASAPSFQVRMADPDWLTVSGYLHVKCGYRLIVDNLLDLSHLAYVHASSTGNRELAENAKIAAETVGDRVRVTRWMTRVPAAPAFVEYAKYDGPIDRWQGSEFMPPGYVYVNSGTVRSDAARGGTTGDGTGAPPHVRMSSQGEWGFVVYHALTPETARTTHQFWAVSLPARFVAPERREIYEQQMRAIPVEDLLVYEAQQHAIDLDPSARGDVNPGGTIPADEGLIAARRILRRLYGAERLSPAT
jgi:phenylpropionate dioxygenase-like ring-hydroxylating dioxygenase large terminal subunit